MYLLAFVRPKVALIILLLVILAVFTVPVVGDLSKTLSSIDLNTRSWDTVPTFQSFGEVGNLLRFIVWPLLLISGGYFFVSPSPLFGLMAAMQLTVLAYSFYYRKPFLPLSLFVVLGIVAVLAPGYTSYIRYAYPVMLVAIIFAVPAKPSKFQNHKTDSVYDETLHITVTRPKKIVR